MKVSYSPLISSLIEYLALLDVFTGNMFLIQVTFGGGSPVASHIRWAVWSTSTAFATGDLVIFGKPGGSLSAMKNKTIMQSMFKPGRHFKTEKESLKHNQKKCIYIHHLSSLNLNNYH